MQMSDAATIVREVEEFYRGYIEGFNREDRDIYLRSFCYPNAVLRGEHGMTVHAKEPDQQRYYEELMVAIREEAWDHTGLGQLHVAPLTDRTAILIADITRYKKDNTAIENARLCYTVRKDGSAWKILTLTDVKPPFTGPSAK
jgi:hypothetical protein